MPEVHAVERDLGTAALDEPPHVLDHALGTHAAAGPPRLRHDAETAAVLAAVLDLHERTRPTERGRGRARGRGEARELGERHRRRGTHVADLDACRSARRLQYGLEQS